MEGATGSDSVCCNQSRANSQFLDGVNSGNVDSTEVTLLMTQSRDLWAQGPSSGTTEEHYLLVVRQIHMAIFAL